MKFNFKRNVMKDQENKDLNTPELNTETTPDTEMELVADENTAVPEPAETEVTSGLSKEEQLLKELAEAKDRHLRLYSEFENYKRRTSKERVELLMTANREVLQALLPVLDDFDRALKSMEKSTDINAVKEGVELVSNKLKTILTSKGLKEMESTGKDFDADFHEAITNVPNPEMKNKVVDTLEKGYLLNDRVIRFAKVVVGS